MSKQSMQYRAAAAYRPPRKRCAHRQTHVPLDAVEARLLLAAAVVNWNDVRQVIDGFGASSAWMSGTIPNPIFDQLYNPVTGAGLSLLRSRVTPAGLSTENQIMQQVSQYGVTSWSTPWTPPREWKTNHDTNNGGSLDPAHYQDYANHLANYVEQMTRQGIPLYAISIQNEPNWTADYESCRWDAQQFAAFLPYLGQTFAARNITTKIVLPEQLNWNFSLANTIMANSSLAQYVGILAAHNYGEVAGGYVPYANAGGRSVWETEMSVNSSLSELAGALDMANDVHQALSDANANAYHYWWLNTVGGTASFITASWGATKRLWAMGQYSRFVRPGWVRIGETDDGGLDITTFKDPASGKFAIVAVNTSTSNTVNETFSFNGFSASNVTPYITSASDNLTAYASIPVTNGTTFTYSIAPSSIVTFYGQIDTALTIQAPNNLRAIPRNGATNSQIALSWSDNSSAESAYTVERSTDRTNWTVVTTSIAANGITYTDSGRAENTVYHYRVKPTNGDLTTYSAVVSTATVLTAPSGVGLARQGNGINVTWTINSGTSTGVTVDRSLDGITWTTVANLVTRATFYLDVIPAYSSTQFYAYRVRNTGAGKVSAFGSANTGISAPTGFAAGQVLSNAITFAWTPPTSGASGAWIEQSISGAWTRVSPTSLLASAGNWTMTGLNGNTAYSFRLRFSIYADSVNSGNSSTVNATTPFQTVWYKANENSGTSLKDSFNAAHNGTLSGSTSFTAGLNGNALNLNGGYATLHNGIVSSVNDFTIAAWVRPSSLVDNARIFDFGNGTSNSFGMYMMTQAPGTVGRPRFVISNSAGTQTITSNISIPANAWSHLALTLSGNTATLYVSGSNAGITAAMTIHPAALGTTTQNYLGRSQGADPGMLGSIDDFQIYGRAFTLSEVQALATVNSQLAWYKANESLGGILTDSSGARNDASLTGTYNFTTGLAGNAVALSAGAANLPVGIVGGLNDFTISTWVKLSALDNWSRIFDFGTSTTNYMFLTPRNNSSLMPRFAIRTDALGEQTINSSVALTLNTWTHLAVTLSGNTGTLYINGIVRGTNAGMTTHPVALGATTQNYIGDSQWSNDPFLKGSIDDFRLYSRALSATEVQQLANPTIATPATASGVTSTTASLSVLGADVTGGEPSLTYSWATTGSPPAPVVFTINGTNAAKSTTAVFTKAGIYQFLVTVTNAAGLTVTSATSVTINSTVLARKLFYGGSAFDGATHDNAIAPDKSALLPGGTATFANYSSHSRGINGVLLDIRNPSGTLTASDFIFLVGNDNSPAGWATAPPPLSVVNRPGAGTSGSTRVEITWADNAIANKWLQIRLKGGNGTISGLAADDVFYFGNAIGDTGNNAANAQVDVLDEIAVRVHPADLSAQPAATALANVYDLNRDAHVNAADETVAGSNYTFFLNRLNLITVPVASPAVLSDEGISSILSAGVSIALTEDGPGTIDEAFMGLVPVRIEERPLQAIIERDLAIKAVSLDASAPPASSTKPNTPAKTPKMQTLTAKTLLKRGGFGKLGMLMGWGPPSNR